MVKKQHSYTEEQIKYLRKIAPGKPVAEITKMFNKKFGANVTARAMGTKLSRCQIKTHAQGLSTRFKKGHRTWNKGMKGLMLNDGSTYFTKGHRPPNQVPVGTEVNREGVVEVKVAEPNVWRLKHHIVYEEVHGEIPENHFVIFADGNKTNFDPANLIAVTRGEFTRMWFNGWRSDDAEITKVGAMMAKIASKTAELERER